MVSPMEFTTAELARLLDAQLVGDGCVVIRGVAPPEDARSDQIVVAENEGYFKTAAAGMAAAILAPSRFKETTKPILLVKNPRLAMAKLLRLFYPELAHRPGIAPSAIVAATAQIDPSATIGPGCVVEDGASIGPRTILYALVYVGPGSRIGAGCQIFPHVTIYGRVRIGDRVRIHAGSVIGSDGYGYAFDGSQHVKIPQIGGVIIEDDVEIGANVTVDSGTLTPTIIGKGTKIDNLVQIAHNVQIGKHCLIVSQVGIAGSTKLGDYVTLAGQVGVAGHLTLGDRVTVGAKAGVMNSIPAGQMWLGIPACPASTAKRQIAAVQKLPDLLKRFKRLEQEVAQLRERLSKLAEREQNE